MAVMLQLSNKIKGSFDMAKYNYVDWPGLQYYHKKVEALIDRKLEQSLRFGGNCLAEKLPSPDTPDVNTLYRVVNELRVDPSNSDWFAESLENKTYPSGVILIVTEDAVYDIFINVTEASSTNLDEVEQLIDSKLQKLNIEETNKKVNQNTQDIRALQSQQTAVTETLTTIEKEYVKQESVDKIVNDKIADVVTSGVEVGAISYGEF